ncbi:MAG TPA: DUF6483 family protein [Ruminococcus sp.]
MFEQDYIMRQIQQIIQILMKIIFKIDTASPETFLIKEIGKREQADDMLRNIDSGNIAEAEQMLFTTIKNRTLDDLLVALVFYSHLNEKDDDFFETNNYSRSYVENSIKRLLSEYGLEHLAYLFFYD